MNIQSLLQYLRFTISHSLWMDLGCY